jgi:hypothetical protein
MGNGPRWVIPGSRLLSQFPALLVLKRNSARDLGHIPKRLPSSPARAPAQRLLTPGFWLLATILELLATP